MDGVQQRRCAVGCGSVGVRVWCGIWCDAVRCGAVGRGAAVWGCPPLPNSPPHRRHPLLSGGCRFLRFLTGTPRLPPGGLAALQPRLTVVRKLSHAAAAAGGGGGGATEGTSVTLGSSGISGGGSSMPLPPGAYNPADGDLPSGEPASEWQLSRGGCWCGFIIAAARLAPLESRSSLHRAPAPAPAPAPLRVQP